MSNSSSEMKLWFQLVSEDGKPYKGTSATKVSVSSSALVVHFRDAVKDLYADSLIKDVDPSDLVVYKNKAAFDEKVEPLQVDDTLEKYGKSKGEALVVVVPSLGIPTVIITCSSFFC